MIKEVYLCLSKDKEGHDKPACQRSADQRLVFCNMFYFGKALHEPLSISYSAPDKVLSKLLHSTLTNFSIRFLVLCKFYTDVGGIK